jgi:hypothetical protein
MSHKEKDDYILHLQRNVENLKEVISMYQHTIETLKCNSATEVIVNKGTYIKNENGVIGIYELENCLVIEKEDEVIKFVNTPYSVTTQKA